MPYPLIAFFSVCIFALVHIYANNLQYATKEAQSRFLSAGSGVAIAFVFVNLLPKLCKNNEILKESFSGLFPYFERHVYVMALVGFLLFFLVDRVSKTKNDHRKYWLSLTSYALFNFLVGYSVVDKNDPEIQPLALFTIAIGLHYFTNDYALNKHYSKEYGHTGKWILVASLFLGWFIGVWASLPAVAIAVVSAFIGGGIIMNVSRHELPNTTPGHPSNVWAFLFSAIAYAVLLLAIGK